MNRKAQRYPENSEIPRIPEITLRSELIHPSVEHALAFHLIFNLTSFPELLLGAGHQ